MSRHHRNFLHHLSVNPRPLRTLVTNANDLDLLEAYNTALQSLKEFRDAHMIIVALYIIGPAKRMRAGAPKGVEDKVDAAKGVDNGKELLKGTGGTDLVKFLKGVRDRTKGALINHPTGEDNDVISWAGGDTVWYIQWASNAEIYVMALIKAMSCLSIFSAEAVAHWHELFQGLLMATLSKWNAHNINDAVKT